jgi:AcrR family transcriptional regulator
VSPAKPRQHAKARDHRASVEAAIFDAIERFLADHSFRELTVEDVIAPSGLGRTAFYRYFPDLETVLLRRLAQIDQELGDATDSWLEPSPEVEPEEGLATAALALAVVYRRHAALLRAFAEAAAAGADVEAAWRDLVGTFIERARERIEALAEAGQVSIDGPGEVARALVWMTERYLLETYGRGEDVPTEVAATTVAQIWRRTLFGAPG